jgi:hypothetical protein
LRAMRVAPPCQLALPIGDQALPADRWDTLPEARQAEVLALLGRLIARGVLVGQITGRAEQGDGEARR